MMGSVCTVKRIQGLDFLKYVCAFLVICIHTTFPGKAIVEPIARTAVPLFFMVTGYNYAQILERNKQRDQIVKILKIGAFANGLYMAWEFLLAIISSRTADLIKSWLTPRLWIKFVLLNESPFSSRLWYIGALLYVLLIVGLLQKKGKRENLYKWIPILLAMNLVLGTYSPILLGRVFPLEYSRNFLCIGFPCFLLGDCLRENMDRKPKGKGFDLLLVVVLLIALTAVVAEQWILTERDLLKNRDFFISTIFVAIPAFCLVIRHERLFEKGFPAIIAMWGKKFSLGIYICNKIVRELIYRPLDFVAGAIPMCAAILNDLSPVVVLVGTTIFVACTYHGSIIMKETCRITTRKQL